MGEPARDERALREMRRVTERAIRRLDMLEWVILGAAAVLALLGGAVVGFLASAAAGWSFRLVWAVSSLALFAVPAAVAWWQNRREERPGANGPPVESEGKKGSAHGR